MRNLWVSFVLVFLSVFSSTWSSPWSSTWASDDRPIHLVVPKFSRALDQSKDKEICVESYTTNYEKVPLAELDPSFKSRRDVQRYYEELFDEERMLFSQGKLLWVQAFLDNQLVGWVTFDPYSFGKNEVFVRNIVVSPQFQRRGIGEKMLFSIKTEKNLRPNTQTLYLIVRKVNEKALKFYKKLGFVPVPGSRTGGLIVPDGFVGLQYRFP